jgi:hypothetical protein
VNALFRISVADIISCLCLRPRKTAYAGHTTKAQGGQEISDREVARQREPSRPEAIRWLVELGMKVKK